MVEPLFPLDDVSHLKFAAHRRGAHPKSVGRFPRPRRVDSNESSSAFRARMSHSQDELGIPPSAKEAAAFTLPAGATLGGFPGNVPSATGARRAVVLGSITPKP